MPQGRDRRELSGMVKFSLNRSLSKENVSISHYSSNGTLKICTFLYQFYLKGKEKEL